jgi:erythromycin esterase-like protein
MQGDILVRRLGFARKQVITELPFSNLVRLSHMHKVTFCTAILLILLAYLPAYAQSELIASGDESALNSATKGLCHTQVVMLGESLTHGDGHTVAFKGALIERLIDQCGFDSVYFEASHYQFIHLNQKLRIGRVVTTQDLLSAAGGLWEFDQEFQPLASFLLSKAQSGQVFLGGLDDQLGLYGQDYANVELFSNLTNLLPPLERQDCSAILHKRIYSDYTDVAPYSKSDRSQIDTCLSEMNRAAAADKVTTGKEMQERQEMISAAERWISRDFSSGPESIVNRDRSMFQDFEWLQNREPKRHKVIVWAATVHIAKQADPIWGDHAGTNFGSFMHRKYGHSAFSLGFSALTGSYRQGRREILEMPPAPVDSVEARALRGGYAPASYVGPWQLAAMGTLPGAFFRHAYETLPWSTFLDGVVVFQAEHPPSDLRVK